MSLFGTTRLLPTVMIMAASVSAAYAAERPIQSFFEEVLERPFNAQLEVAHLKASHSRAERQGDDLILWTGSSTGGGMRLTFHDGAEPEHGPGIVRYSYYGGTEIYDLVVQELPRTPLAIYFIERTGVIHRFSVEDLSPYLTPSGHHLLSIGKFGDLSILGARADEGYQDEFSCRAKPPAAAQTPEIHTLSDDAIEIELTGPLGAPRLLKLHRDGRRWKVVEPVQMWSGYSCN